jgi:membrane-associated phospholipid phosphatase
VAGTAAPLGILAVVVGLNGGRVANGPVAVVAVLVVSAVALSRLYLGVH